MFSLRVQSVDLPDAIAALTVSAAADDVGTSTSGRWHIRIQSHLPRSSNPLPSTTSATTPSSFLAHGAARASWCSLSRPASRRTTSSASAAPTSSTPLRSVSSATMGVEDRYSVLVEFDDQKSADGFYLDLNGWRFSSSEVEVCHVLFIVAVQYTSSTELDLIPPVGSTELPTCPVCIERLDQDISGIGATNCDHSFQCSCVSMWVSSSCPVCQFCQKLSEAPTNPTCSVCRTSENLWICVICGFVGCGRYKEGHSIRHWKGTQHCYSLDLETQHMGGVMFSSKADTIVDEYNRLLASQLETQLREAKKEREHHISVAVDKTINDKLQELQLKFENTMLRKERRAQLKLKDDMILDLEEQIKDFRYSIKLQKSIAKSSHADDLKGGMLVPLAMDSDSGKGKRSQEQAREGISGGFASMNYECMDLHHSLHMLSSAC
ncbi:hypothetical protein ZWY2020_006881 [Hordeum vulgare]|nr:hypothetical protein ZWY2020_006881 [Hordeum vulgare]